MWLLSNETPFCAERTWIRDRDGAEVWIVAVKGAFLIDKEGRQFLDGQQSDVLRVPTFRGPPEASSLCGETDLVHTKRRTDVLVDGYAMSPSGTAVRTIDVRLKIAGIDKTLRVHGERIVDRGLLGASLSDPAPFTEMPLVWERAFGGTDIRSSNPDQHGWEPRNPVGVGFATQVNHLLGMPAPNIEDPQSPYLVGARNCTPGGFGPIARHWIPRVKYAGTYDKRWEETRRPLLPSDFDERFYQCAPEDQQVDGYLTGGEYVELFNLTPESYLAFPVPKLTIWMTTRFYDGTEVEHRPVLHTVVVQPKRRRFEIVWHSALACHQRVNKLAITRVMMKKRINLSQQEKQSGMWTGH